jgi:hypothetical protein
VDFLPSYVLGDDPRRAFTPGREWAVEVGEGRIRPARLPVPKQDDRTHPSDRARREVRGQEAPELAVWPPQSRRLGTCRTSNKPRQLRTAEDRIGEARRVQARLTSPLRVTGETRDQSAAKEAGSEAARSMRRNVGGLLASSEDSIAARLASG